MLKHLFIILALCVALSCAQPYTWEQALQTTKANNLELKIAREKVQLKQNSLDALRSALWPQVGANLSFSTGASAPENENPLAQDPNSSESARLSVQQQVWDPQTAPRLKQGELELETEKLNYAIQEINLRLQLRQEFCELLRTAQSLDLAQTVSERRRQQYELVELRYSGGLEHRGSLLTARANLVKAELSEKQLQRRLERNKQQFAQTMGLPATHNIEITPDLELRTDLQQTPDIAQLLDDSPVLQAVAARLDSAEYSTAIARAAYLPSVYVNGSLGKNWAQSRASGAAVNSEDSSWSLGTGLSFDLLDGGKKSLAVDSARTQETIQRLELDNSRRTTALTLDRAWDNLLDAEDSIQAAREQLQATSERSTIAAEQYANGLISFDNWIIIEDALISAQQQELSSRIDALIQEANWLNARGGNLDEI
ncbi:MAG: TolC family protein [Candidatus Margulisbacteria bacterium]|nr:TolC family protein [Candidatus Margulisiibacteriota bacterium]